MREAKMTPETTISSTRHHCDSKIPDPDDVTEITETRSTVTTSNQPDTLTGKKTTTRFQHIYYIF